MMVRLGLRTTSLSVCAHAARAGIWLFYDSAPRYTAQPFFPFALMPRGQLLSCVTKVTKDTNKGRCPLFIPKGLCSTTKDAPNLPDYVNFPLNVSNVIFLRARRKENDAWVCAAS